MALGHESYPWSSRQNYKVDMEIIILRRTLRPQLPSQQVAEKEPDPALQRRFPAPPYPADHSQSQGPQVQNFPSNPVSPQRELDHPSLVVLYKTHKHRHICCVPLPLSLSLLCPPFPRLPAILMIFFRAPVSLKCALVFPGPPPPIECKLHGARDFLV